MNIKTYIDGLRQASTALTSLNNMSFGTYAFGVKAGQLTSDSVTKLSVAVAGLNEEQARLVLSTRGLTTSQQNQVLVENGLIATSDKMSASIVSQNLQKKILSETEREQLLIELGLMDADSKRLLTQNACTEAELRAVLAKRGYIGASQDEIVAEILGNKIREKGVISWELLSASIKKAAASLWTFLTTNPVGWAILATGAIAGTVAIYNALTISLEEAQENLEKSSTAFNETTDEIESLNDELKTTEERIKELQKLSDSGTISVADEAELELLKEKNKELARQIALKQRDQIIEGKKTLEDAQELSTKTVTSKYEIEAVGVGKDSRTVYADVSVEKELQNAIDKYNQVKELLNRDDLTEQQREYWEGILGDAEERASEMQGILDAERQAYLDLENAGMALTPEDKERLEFLNDIDDSYLLWNHTLTQTRESFIALNEEQQKSILLNRLLKQGLSDEQANAVLGNIDSSNYNDLWDKDFTFTPPEMTDYATAEEYGKAYATAWLEGVKVATNTEQTFGITEKFKEELDNTFSNQSTFQSALDKIREGTSLTADEVRELVELCPSLAGEFEKTADGWTINTDKLISANGNMVQSTKDSLREQLGLLKTQVSDFEEEYQSLIDSGDYSKGREFYFANIEQIEEAEETITALELTLSMFGLTTEDTTDKVNEFAEMVEKVSKKTSIISTAVEEMNDTGYISASTYADMVEQGGNFAECLEIQDGRIVLNIQKLKELEIEELRAEQAANDLALAQYKLGISSQVEAEALDEIIKKHDEKNAFIESQIQDILNSFNNDGGSSSDPIKAAFDKQMRDTEHAYAKGLISQEEYLNTLEKANEEHYKNSAEHYDDYLANIEKIYNGRKDIFKSTVDEQIKALDEQLEKGFISPAQYQSEMTKLMEQSYGMGSKYYGTEFATENYNEMSDMIEDKDVDVYESKLDELKKANDGSIEAERQFIEKWKSLNKTMFEDTDPKKYKENLEEIAEYEDDWLVRRAENEKTYWENLKQEVEDYYDKEIEKLQSILDEEEKINKQEELRNNLIKARQDLENAKKNRNQLVFANGSFEYTVDQEAVEQAAEAEKDAQRELERYETEQEIALLQEEQKKKIDDIDDVINRIEQYLKELNGETDPTTSDTEVIVSANAVEEVKKAKNSYDSISETNNGSNATVTPEDVGKVFTDSTTEWKEQFASVLNVLGLANANLDAMKNFFTGDTHLQTMSNPSTNTIGGQVVYNNSTVNNDNRQVINIGDINMTIEGDSSEQMLREFASKLGSTIQSITGRIT